MSIHLLRIRNFALIGSIGGEVNGIGYSLWNHWFPLCPFIGNSISPGSQFTGLIEIWIIGHDFGPWWPREWTWIFLSVGVYCFVVSSVVNNVQSLSWWGVGKFTTIFHIIKGAPYFYGTVLNYLPMIIPIWCFVTFNLYWDIL